MFGHCSYIEFGAAVRGTLNLPLPILHSGRRTPSPGMVGKGSPASSGSYSCAKTEKVRLQSLLLRQHHFATNSPLPRPVRLSRCFTSGFDSEDRTSEAAGSRVSFSPGRFSPRLWTPPRKYGTFSTGGSSGWPRRSGAELEVSLGRPRAAKTGHMPLVRGASIGRPHTRYRKFEALMSQAWPAPIRIAPVSNVLPASLSRSSSR